MSASAALGHKFFQGTRILFPAAADATAVQEFARARELLNTICQEVPQQDPLCQKTADAAKWLQIKNACDGVV